MIPTSRLVYLIVISFMLILVSVIIDLAVALHNAHLSKDDYITEVLSVRFLTWETAAGFLRELGFAAAIAWALAVTVERIAMERESKELSESRMVIAQDVFRAMVGPDLPREIRDLSFDTIFLSPLIRSFMRLDVRLSSLPEKYGPLGENFILVTYGVTYEVRNTSSLESTFNVDLYIEKCPNAALSTESKLSLITIGDEALAEQYIVQGSLAIPHTDGELRYRWPRLMPPRGILRVSIRWTGVKSLNDNTTWTSLIPTSEFELRFEPLIPGLVWGVDPMFHGVMRAVETRRDFGVNEFLATKPLLPYQGIQIWWRPPGTVEFIPPS